MESQPKPTSRTAHIFLFNSVQEKPKDAKTVLQEVARCHDGGHLSDLMADEVGIENC